MANTEWNDRRPGEYSRWNENIHPYDTLGEYNEEEEEEDEEEYSFYEEMLADSFISDVSYAVGTMKLSVSSAPRLTISEGVPITFNYSDKATVTQEVTDGQLSLTVQENTALESIKICIDNRTWVIPLNTLPIFPPLMPKKR